MSWGSKKHPTTHKPPAKAETNTADEAVKSAVGDPKVQPASETCSGCQYWTPTTTECKRYPPQILQPYGGNPDIRFAFPKIAGADWCGDWVKSGG